MKLEDLGKLKISTSSGLEPATLPVCSIVPQPTTLPRAPLIMIIIIIIPLIYI
jgi:hypothetical protein